MKKRFKNILNKTKNCLITCIYSMVYACVQEVRIMVHEHFSLFHIYDCFFGSSYYYKADDSEKAKVT